MITDCTASPEIYTRKQLRDMMAAFIPSSRIPRKLNIVTDTSDFFRVNYDDVIFLNKRPYIIRNNKYEGRFGLDDQPKFWVKSAKDLLTGESKIIKMVFYEKFTSNIGDLTFDCFRSPEKEARILSLVKGHPNFMQGFSTNDSAGGIIRVIDYIPGTTICEYVLGLGNNHEDYFHNYFTSVLDDYIKLVEAIQFLHDHKEKHGDIRRDHIIRDKKSGLYRWIDFDFNYTHKENMFSYDLFGLGNILVYLTGRGDVTTYELEINNKRVFGSLSNDDRHIVFQNRIVNLKKVYPYIPDLLNNILLQFSAGANIFYDNTSQLINDIKEAKENLGHDK